MRSCQFFEKTTAAFDTNIAQTERGENCGENAKNRFLISATVAE